VLSYPGVAAARRAMATNLSRGRACRTTLSGTSLRLVPMSFPRLGAQSFALKILASRSGTEQPIGGNVFLRSGSRVGYLNLLSPRPDLAQFRGFARKALVRLG
jgi:hypothetical protein